MVSIWVVSTFFLAIKKMLLGIFVNKFLYGNVFSSLLGLYLEGNSWVTCYLRNWQFSQAVKTFDFPTTWVWRFQFFYIFLIICGFQSLASVKWEYLNAADLWFRLHSSHAIEVTEGLQSEQPCDESHWCQQRCSHGFTILHTVTNFCLLK